MSVSRSETERRFPLEGSGAKYGLGADPGKWSVRRTLAFIVGASSLLWIGIIYAAIVIF